MTLVNIDIYFFIAFISLCVLLSSMLSATETAITTMSKDKLIDLNKKDSIWQKKLIFAIQNNKEDIISSLLIGNTFINILTSALATSVAIELLGVETGTIISTISLTIIILIFAEVLPKTYAVKNPIKTLTKLSMLIIVFYTILSPISYLISRFVQFILQLFHLNQDKETYNTAKTIRSVLLSSDTDDRSISEKEIHIIDNVLDMAEMTIFDIMTHRKKVISLSKNTTLNDLQNIILNNYHHYIPIWEGDKDQIIGVLDIQLILENLAKYRLNELIKNNENIDLSNYIQKPIFTPDNTLIRTQINNFYKEDKKFAITVDEYGSIQGVITINDMFRELVGDIFQNSDKKSIIKIDKYTYSISAETSIKNLNRKLGWDIPDEYGATIAGLIVNKLARIPDLDESFDIDDYQFKIENQSNNFIVRVIIKKINI
ncbi:MAG: hemolysin family protein [Anaplasmataceae bacterium]|nr:hemolysin family protein [Anaplasmataceae bacterium]